jgi:hypothetical protein
MKIRKLPPLPPVHSRIPLEFPTDYVEPVAPGVLDFRLNPVADLRCYKLSRSDSNIFHYLHSDEAETKARAIAKGRPARLVIYNLRGDVQRVTTL